MMIRLIAAASVSILLAQSPAQPRVRTDGLYRLVAYSNPSDPANPIYIYVRFFEGVAAVDVLSADRPEDVLQWLTKENGTGNPGTYALQGNRLTFERPTATGSITRSGLLVDDAWVMRPESPNPPKYTFIAASSNATVPAGANRAPLVRAAIAVDNRHVLDATGRRVGVTTSVEADASDLDGDPLTFSWSASNGSIVPSGNKVVWRNRPVTSYGAIEEGVLFLEVRDDKGAKTTRAWVLY